MVGEIDRGGGGGSQYKSNTYVKCVEEQWLSPSGWRNDEEALDSLLAKVLISKVSVSGLHLVFPVKMFERSLSDVNPAGKRNRHLMFKYIFFKLMSLYNGYSTSGA